jgi:polyhydroxybutyrate depolymerase
VVSLHPFLVTPEAWEAYSGLAAAAVARGDVVLTPLGSDPGPRWAVPGGLASDANDLAFIAALLDHVEDDGCVDRNRVFAAGFSAGAAMAQAVSCTMPERFAAVAGSGGVNLTALCPDAPGTSALVLHGTADPIAPPGGSQVPFAPPLGLSVDAVVAQNAERAGCTAVPEVDRPSPSVVRSRYRDCTDGRRVIALSLVGAGHTWAGAPNPLLELVTGPTATELSATEAVLDFFHAV